MPTEYPDPDADVSSSGWDAGTSSFSYTLINDWDSTPDSDYAGCADTNNASFVVDLEAIPTPGDFAAATNFDLKIRARSAGRVDDNPYITITLENSGGTPYGSSHTLGYGSSEQTITATFADYTFSDSGWDSLAQSQINEARVRVVYTKASTGMPDTGLQINVAAIQMTLEYTARVDYYLPALAMRPYAPADQRSRRW